MTDDLRKTGRRWIGMLLLAVTTLLGCAGSEVAPPPVEPGAPLAPLAQSCPSFIQASAGLPTTGEWRTHPAIGDVNGDGVNDLAALARKGDGSTVFLGDGLGGWTESSEGLKLPRGFTCGVGTRLVDLDRDGHVDLLEADHCRGVRVFRGNGGESWVDGSRGIPQNMQGFNDADSGDLDGDGLLDIVAISAFSRGFLVLGGRANGTWEVELDSGLPTTGMGFEVQLIDVTGDGRLDVVSTFSPVAADRRAEPPPPAKVWVQEPTGRFVPAGDFPDSGRFFGVATIPGAGSERHALVFALIGAQAGLYLYEPDGGDGWVEAGRIDEGWFDVQFDGFIGVDTADIDGDGCFDIFTTGGGRHGTWLAMGDCNGRWNLCPAETLPQETAPGAGWGVTIGDLNGDGRPDVVAAFGRSGKGGIRAWLQTGP